VPDLAEGVISEACISAISLTADGSFYRLRPSFRCVLSPLNCLQIYSDDIQYSEANADLPVEVMEIDGVNVLESAQELLNQASQHLLEIAEPPERGELSYGRGRVDAIQKNACSEV
jgi:hypothetical protein